MADVYSPLTTKWAVTSDSSPRPGGADWRNYIVGIGHHHTAGTSRAVCLALFQPGGRTVSPNYLIDGKDIIAIVPENRRAWTTSDAIADGGSITYEILNKTGSPNWTFDPDTLESVKKLDADIMRRYPKVKPVHGFPGFWEHKNIYQWFGRSYPTACAGPSFFINNIIIGAKAYYAAGGATPGGGIEVKAYHSEDSQARKVGKTINPGGHTYLHLNSLDNSKASNVVGGVGPYSITPHIYAEGDPGDVVDLVLLWDNTKTTGAHSAHYNERLVFDESGRIYANREFKRGVQAGFAVYVRLNVPASNTRPVKFTVIDCDSYLFVG